MSYFFGGAEGSDIIYFLHSYVTMQEGSNSFCGFSIIMKAGSFLYPLSTPLF
jgi:hypothetical protein